jgi:hypothetical protein
MTQAPHINSLTCGTVTNVIVTGGTQEASSFIGQNSSIEEQFLINENRKRVINLFVLVIICNYTFCVNILH